MLQHHLPASTPSTYSSTISALTQLMWSHCSFVGPSLGDLIRNDIKPALMTTVEAEFAKNPKDASFTPARTSRVTAKGAAGGGAAGPSSKAAGRGGKAAAVVASAAFDADDLLPREDISGSITSKLISELGSANWKERKAAMDEVEGFISAAGNRIQPSVSTSAGIVSLVMHSKQVLALAFLELWHTL
jgi:cytoskeleton-associated protein 5